VNTTIYIIYDQKDKREDEEKDENQWIIRDRERREMKKRNIEISKLYINPDYV